MRMHINSRQDACACRPCTYPNGLVLVLVQTVLVAGLVLSLIAAGDCQFVTVPRNQVNETWVNSIFAESTSGPDSESKDRGFGVFFFEEADGDCSWDHNHTKSTMNEYWDYVGRSDWEVASNVAIAATCFAFVSLVWSFLFSCIAQPKMVRFCFAGFVLVLMPILQAVPFMLLHSEFCDEHTCSLGRSSRSSIAAVVLFFVAGLLMCCTKDCPGQDVSTMLDQNPPAIAAVVPEAKELQVEEGMADVSLVDDAVPAVKAQTY